MTETSREVVLLVDSYNLFIRSYCAYPSMDANGEQVGGVVGYLKTLTRLVRQFSPSRVYVVWESGGSLRRRSLLSSYKKGPPGGSYNRYYEDDLPDTSENRLRQVAMLIRLLRSLPVCQVHVADCEGDDIIAFMVRNRLRGKLKVVVSTDRDYYQLLDDPDVLIYNPTKKVTVTPDDVVKEFRVTAENFVLAKSVCGDAADRIPGIEGIGYKTLAKRYPFLMSKNRVTLDELENYAWSHREEGKYFAKLHEGFDIVRRNWRLVVLDSSMLSAAHVAKLDYVINTWTPTLDKIGFVSRLVSEGINGLDIDDICYAFMMLSAHDRSAK